MGNVADGRRSRLPRRAPIDWVAEFKVRLSFLIFVALVGLAASGRAQEAQRIAAVVNDRIISTYDLAERITVVVRSSGLQDSPEARERLRVQVLRSLIDEQLQVQEAQRLEMVVTEEDRAGSLRFLEGQNNIPDGAMLEALAQRGIPQDSFLAQIDAQVLWGRVVQARLRPAVTVTDAEVSDVLTRLEASRGAPEYRLAEIFLAVDSPWQEAEVAAASQRLIEEISRGADFRALARQFSQSATAGAGGDMGWVLESQLPEEYLSAIAGLGQGEIVGPIATAGGFTVLRLLGTRRAFETDPGDADVTLKLVVLPLPAVASSEDEAGMRVIANDLAARIEGCDGVEALAAEVAGAQTREVGTMPENELTAEVRDAIAGVAIGETSRPVIAGGAYNILVVCDRQQREARLPTRDEVRQSLYNQRLDLAARGYLRDLRRVAFIDIRV